MSLEQVIYSVYTKVKDIDNKGNLASYIPELANVNPDSFGIHISTTNNIKVGLGNYSDKFSIQSISKVLSLTLAYRILGEKIWERLGVEPSGTSFNSLVQLEADKGIPRNPFINAGALVIADILYSNLENPKKDFLSFVRSISNNSEINYSQKIAKSEKDVGYRNIALCNFLKSFNNIKNNPSDVLDFYFDICSIKMSCEELSNLFLFLANNGSSLVSNTKIISKSQSKRINAVMQTCGLYDESGEFAFKVGLPGKSGVGGGIIAIHPGQYSIAVWSPKLNDKGNSHKGIKFLEEFTTDSQLSIF